MGDKDGTNTEMLDNKIDRIIDIMESVELHKLTILTGSNGSGKSLVRKQICFKIANKVEGADYRRIVADVSMQKRTESNVSLGALCNWAHDMPWNPTSLSTFNLIESMFNTFTKEDKQEKNKQRYIIIDEPEIGMSKESLAGFVNYLLKRLPEIMDKTLGIMIITHSEFLVDALKDKAVFLNMDKDITADEWINREIIPTDFEELNKESHELFLALEKRMKGN